MLNRLVDVLDDERLREIARDLCGVPGVRAVSLGGSRARGTHRADSDFDLGVYYEGVPDLGALQRLAARWADEPVPVAPPGDWGPWVDGGAWLSVDGNPVDWILRDLRRVREQCERARRGAFAFHAQPGHPLGFLDVAYAGEVALGVPLSDDDGVLDSLARGLTPYPRALRRSLLDNLWQVDFLLDGAEKAARSADVAYVTLCLTSAAMLSAHGWHALAGRWVINENGIVAGAESLQVVSHGFSEIVATVLGSLEPDDSRLLEAITALRKAPRPRLR